MNTGFNIAHKAVVGTLVFASLWGTYSVAGGTGIVLKRRWDRSQAAKKDENQDDNFYIPVEPSSNDNEPKVKRVNWEQELRTKEQEQVHTHTTRTHYT